MGRYARALRDKVVRELIQFQLAQDILTWELIRDNVIPPPPIVQPNLFSVFNYLPRRMLNQNKIHHLAILLPPNGLVPTINLIFNVRAVYAAAYGVDLVNNLGEFLVGIGQCIYFLSQLHDLLANV